MKAINVRLMPGQDLKKELSDLCHKNNLQASAVVSSVGSLTTAALRMAGAKDTWVRKGPFEILSVNGTLSVGGIHLHMAISDGEGQTFGGHLLDGNIINTTCELVLLEQPDVQFKRELDPQTKFKELKIIQK